MTTDTHPISYSMAIDHAKLLAPRSELTPGLIDTEYVRGMVELICSLFMDGDDPDALRYQVIEDITGDADYPGV